MRGLVTHAGRLRWLTVQSEDPMWMVRYAKKASGQGTSAVYVPRSSLPTDDECAASRTAPASAGANSSHSSPERSSSSQLGSCTSGAPSRKGRAAPPA